MQKTCKIALAFSGGLDTTYCAALLASQDYDVHTVHVNTGGVDAAALDAIEKQAYAAGAAVHHAIDARAEVFEKFLVPLIRGNVLRGGVYPLSVAAERTQQAMSVAAAAKTLGAGALAHGSTGAGNDQVRFDVAFRILAPELPILTPIRDGHVQRPAAAAWLQERNIPVPPKSGDYSINKGIWGTTWGGGWTHDTWAGPPAELVDPPADAPAPCEIVIGWGAGIPRTVDGEALAGADLVETLDALADAYGIGRAIHTGETALGIKGRIGFAAGAAHLLIAAHRELEKLVLTRWQLFWKETLAQFYGDRLHEGQWFDPALRDIESFFATTQVRVEGETRIRLAPGRFLVTGTRSPYSLFTAGAAYGERNDLFDGDSARGFAKVAAVAAQLAAKAGASS